MSAPDAIDVMKHNAAVRLLGMQLGPRGDDQAEIRMPLREDLLQLEGVVHGGLLATLADTAAVYVIYPDLPPDRIMTSIEFKLNFTRPALADRGDIVARARRVQQGRSIALCDVDVEQDGRLVAKGLFTYLLKDRG